MQYQHENLIDQFSCQKCFLEGFYSAFDTIEELREHVTVCASDNTRRCPFCSHFFSNDEINVHIMNHHPDPKEEDNSQLVYSQHRKHVIKSGEDQTKSGVITKSRPTVFKLTESSISISDEETEVKSARDSMKKKPLSDVFSTSGNSIESTFVGGFNTQEAKDYYGHATPTDKKSNKKDDDDDVGGILAAGMQGYRDTGFSDTGGMRRNREESLDRLKTQDEEDELEIQRIKQRIEARKKSELNQKDQGQESLVQLEKQAMKITDQTLKSQLLKNDLQCNGQTMTMTTAILKSMVETKKEDLDRKSRGKTVVKWSKERIREHLCDSGLKQINMVNIRTFNENVDRVKKSAAFCYKSLKRLAETGGGELGSDLNEYTMPSRDEGNQDLNSDEKLLAELWEQNLELDRQLAKKVEKKKNAKEKSKDKFMSTLLNVNKHDDCDEESEAGEYEFEQGDDADKRAQKRSAEQRRVSVEKLRKKDNAASEDSTTTESDFDPTTAVKQTFKRANIILDKAQEGQNSNLENRILKNEQEVAIIKQDVAVVRKEVSDMRKELSDTKKEVQEGNAVTHNSLQELLSRMDMKKK